MKQNKYFHLLPLLLATLLLCTTAAVAATNWQALMRQSSTAAVQAANQQTPEGLSLSEDELALYRLGFAQGYDAGQGTTSTDSDEPMVWIPVHGGTKYHAKSSCSSMKSPMEVTLSTALEKGYEPCKSCNPPTK